MSSFHSGWLQQVLGFAEEGRTALPAASGERSNSGFPGPGAHTGSFAGFPSDCFSLFYPLSVCLLLLWLPSPRLSFLFLFLPYRLLLCLFLLRLFLLCLFLLRLFLLRLFFLRLFLLRLFLLRLLSLFCSCFVPHHSSFAQSCFTSILMAFKMHRIRTPTSPKMAIHIFAIPNTLSSRIRILTAIAKQIFA